MKKLNRKNAGVEVKLPIKVVQYGEGNFLRAFIDYAFQQLNKKLNFNLGVAVVQPIDQGLVSMLNEQDGLYTVFMNGVKKGVEIKEQELITTIVKAVNPYASFEAYMQLAKESELEFVISNTTEAGIAYVASDTLEMQPPSSFPAKLTQFLAARFNFFHGDPSKGLTIIPCELINYNADTLKEIILKYADDWQLDDEFKSWVNSHCSFHNTLVDRIVPGYPKDEIEAYNKRLDYQDNLIVTAEQFFLWVIEGGATLKEKLPFHKTALDVKIVSDMQPYRTLKVRILNGAHTSMVPFSILYGMTTVKEAIDNDFVGTFVDKILFDEINQTLQMDKNEIHRYAEEVLDRFRNPFIKHQLADIALNSISKFKVRVLPSFLEYIVMNKKIPSHLTFSLACLIRFYKGTWNGSKLPIKDDQEVVEAFEEIWKLNDFAKISKAALENEAFWGVDLSRIETLTDAITVALTAIETNGIEKGFANFSKQYN